MFLLVVRVLARPSPPPPQTQKPGSLGPTEMTVNISTPTPSEPLSFLQCLVVQILQTLWKKGEAPPWLAPCRRASFNQVIHFILRSRLHTLTSPR